MYIHFTLFAVNLICMKHIIFCAIVQIAMVIFFLTMFAAGYFSYVYWYLKKGNNYKIIILYNFGS